MWNLEGLTVRGLYMGEYPVSGRVELSRVKYGGEVVHAVALEKPLNLRWRAEPAERLLVEHKYIEQVQG